MSTFPNGNAMIVDLSYEEALIEAFLRKGEGQSIEFALEKFPGLAPYIRHSGDGVAHLDVASALAHARMALKARSVQPSEKRHLFSSLYRGVRCALQVGLFFLPPVIGAGVAVYLIAHTDNWGFRILSGMLGWLITSFGYAALFIACSLIRGSHRRTSLSPRR